MPEPQRVFAHLSAPNAAAYRAVLAVFARENGQGISFKEEEGGSEPPPASPAPPASAEPPSNKGPRLKLVK